MAHELQGRGGVGMRGPVDAILEDQVLLGERLGLAVIPRRAEKDAVGAKSRQVLRTSSNRKSYRPLVCVGVKAHSCHARILRERLCAACAELIGRCNGRQASVLGLGRPPQAPYNHPHVSQETSLKPLERSVFKII